MNIYTIENTQSRFIRGHVGAMRQSVARAQRRPSIYVA